jgi:hypothetical protein
MDCTYYIHLMSKRTHIVCAGSDIGLHPQLVDQIDRLQKVQCHCKKPTIGKLHYSKKKQIEHQRGVQAFRRTGATRKNSDPPSNTNKFKATLHAGCCAPARPQLRKSPLNAETRGYRTRKTEKMLLPVSPAASRRRPGKETAALSPGGKSNQSPSPGGGPPSSVPSSRTEATETAGRRKAWTRKYAFEGRKRI